eukprot:2987020-Rhodomonas_salina.1
MTGRTRRARPRGAGRAKSHRGGAERARFLRATLGPARCTPACCHGITGPEGSGVGNLDRAWCPPRRTWIARA